jgi:hypothetical protein
MGKRKKNISALRQVRAPLPLNVMCSSNQMVAVTT